MGRQIKRIGLILALIAGSLLMAVPAYATDPPTPDNLQFESAMVFRHLIEDDDALFVFHFNIHYDSEQPDEPANHLFTFRLLETDGESQLGAVIPYAYYNAGYDQGCAAFYFPAAEAPTWGSAYILRISGNPEYFSTPPLCSHTLVASEYSQVDTQEENQTLLGNYILDAAADLEINWDTTLLYVTDLGMVLNSTGEGYFRGAIPGLAAMAPQIFPVQLLSPEYEDPGWTEEQGEAYAARFEDTWVGESLSRVGEDLHMGWNVITGILVFGVILALGIFCQYKYGTIKPIMIGGIAVMLGGTVMGWIAPAIMAIVTIFFALWLGYIWMFRHG
jgi:hypothetical protein